MTESRNGGMYPSPEPVVNIHTRRIVGDELVADVAEVGEIELRPQIRITLTYADPTAGSLETVDIVWEEGIAWRPPSPEEISLVVRALAR